VYETQEYRQALSDVTGLLSAGVIHPDGFASNAPVKNWFNAGNALMIADRYTAWPQYYAQNVAGPSFAISGMRPPLYNGGGYAGTWQSPPTNNFTALKKADKGRIQDLLTIANYLAAPFGTAEFLFRRFGVEGVDYNMKNGGPVLTQQGNTETVLGIRYIVDAPDAIFIPGNATATQASYDYQKSIIPTSVKDPTVGLFSDTWSRKQAALTTILQNAQNDILQGRAPISSFDDALTTWKSSGGDAVRSEYETQIQKNGH
jgi:putative aldouronate transport system substrate-binding protein